MNLMQTKLSSNNAALDGIRHTLFKFKSELSSIPAIESQVENVQRLVEENADEISLITVRLDNSEV